MHRLKFAVDHFERYISYLVYWVISILIEYIGRSVAVKITWPLRRLKWLTFLELRWPLMISIKIWPRNFQIKGSRWYWYRHWKGWSCSSCCWCRVGNQHRNKLFGTTWFWYHYHWWFQGRFETITKEQILTLRRKLSMVFQQFNLFERRTALIIEGLKIVKKLSDDEATKIAKEELTRLGFLIVKITTHVTCRVVSNVWPCLCSCNEAWCALAWRTNICPWLSWLVEKSIADAAKSGQTMVLACLLRTLFIKWLTRCFFLEKDPWTRNTRRNL